MSFGSLSRARAWLLGRPVGPVVLAGALGFLLVPWLVSYLAVVERSTAFGHPRPWNVANEANVWTWANAAVFVFGAALHAGRALAHAPARAGLGWLLGACALLALSLDDVASFHEELDPVGRQMGGGEGFTHFAWVLPGLMLGAAFAGVLLLGAWLIRGRAALVLLLGAAVLLLGALGIEATTGAILSGGGSQRLYKIAYHVEEGVEAIGAALLLAAAAFDIDGGRRPIRAWLSRSPPPG